MVIPSPDIGAAALLPAFEDQGPHLTDALTLLLYSLMNIELCTIKLQRLD
jgi:hypothetical protein